MVRVAFCTSGGLPGALVLGRLLACPRIRVAGIVRSSRVLSASYGFLRGAWEQYRRSGLRYTLYLGLAAAPRLRADGVPVLRTRDLNQERESIERLAPDLLVSAFFNQRIAEAIAAMPRLGAVNIHPSLLPAFKGVDPVFYARLRDSASLGVTLHRISPELDSGDVIAQEPCAAAQDESVLRTTARLYDRGAALLVDSLERLMAREQGSAQAGPGQYDSWPTRVQVASLRRKGVRLVGSSDLFALALGKARDLQQPLG